MLRVVKLAVPNGILLQTEVTRTLYALVMKIKYVAESESRKHILQQDSNARLLNEITALVESDTSIHPTIKNVYLPLLKLTKDKSLTAYKELKEFLIHDTIHNKREKLAILMYVLNFITSRSRTDEAASYKEYFEVTQIGLEQSLFTAAGHFPSGTFINIVNSACYHKNYIWAKAFIENSSKDLNPNDVLFARNLAVARVHFEQKKFMAARTLLNEIVQYENVHDALRVRLLLCWCNYETKENESVQISHCDAFEKYVHVNKLLNPILKTNVSNFIKILRFLINEKPKNQIIKALESKGKNIAYSDWLKEKIEALKS